MKRGEYRDKSIFTLDGRFIGWSIGDSYENDKHILDIKIPLDIVDTLPPEKAKKIETKKFSKHGILSINTDILHAVDDAIILRTDENLNEIKPPSAEKTEELKEFERIRSVVESIKTGELGWLKEFMGNTKKGIDELKNTIESLRDGMETLKGVMATVMPIEAEEKVVAERISELMEKRIGIMESLENTEHEFMEGALSEDEYDEKKKEDKKRLEKVEEYLYEALKRKNRLARGKKGHAKEETKEEVKKEKE